MSLSTTLQRFNLDSSLQSSHYHVTRPSHLLSFTLPKTNTKSKSLENVIGLKNVENYTSCQVLNLALVVQSAVPQSQRSRCSQWGVGKSLNGQEKFWQRKVKRKSSAQNFSCPFRLFPATTNYPAGSLTMRVAPQK